MSSESVHKGICMCGSISYAVKGKPLFSIYCHCINCQKADGAAFVAAVHFPDSAFSWTCSEVEPLKESLGDIVLYRCSKCRSCMATQILSSKNWALRATQLDRGEDGKIIGWDEVKPTGHIFYGRRVVDVADSLPKWEGARGTSTKLA
ncbi:Mss4-like protein [Mycena crocata]|nr:Mss4-like protein [Mycena crocata]